MPSLVQIVKGLCSGVAIPGTFLLFMGLGIAPLDEGLVAIANPFIGPLAIPAKPFFLTLGSCKILGVLSLWKIGPMPEWFARAGLTFAACCAAYGHHSVGEPLVPPLVYSVLISSLWVLDPLNGKAKKS